MRPALIGIALGAAGVKTISIPAVDAAQRVTLPDVHGGLLICQKGKSPVTELYLLPHKMTATEGQLIERIVDSNFPSVGCCKLYYVRSDDYTHDIGHFEVTSTSTADTMFYQYIPLRTD